MDHCPVCLEVGAEPCTECGRLYHAKCIGQLLERGFDNCQCCFMSFSPTLHIKAAEYAVEHENNSPESQVQLAAALTSAGRASVALGVLKAIHARAVQSRLELKVALHLELGRAYLNIGQPQLATRELLLVLMLTKMCGYSAFGLPLRAMTLLTTAYFEQKDYEMVHKIAGATMRQVHRMNHREAVCIMRVVADTYKAQGYTDKYRNTLEAISAIVTEESRDALAKAFVAVELGVIEHEMGVRSIERLKPAIRTLRKHKRAIARQACLALQAQVRASKRLLKKTHPEDVR